MTFNPLGNFRADAPLQDKVLVAARAFEVHLPNLLPDEWLHGIYGHWTVGHPDQDFPDYNGSVGCNADGTFFLHMPHTPLDNACDAAGECSDSFAAHTWLRNSGGFGFSLDGMLGATTKNFGAESDLGVASLHYFCAGVAAVAKKYGIDLAGTKPAGAGRYAGEPTFLTHARAAVLGGTPAHPLWYNYGPSGTCERWDFATLVPLPEGMALTDEMAQICCEALNGLAHAYKLAL